MIFIDWASAIRRWRLLHGAEQKTLAELVGVSQETVSRWERGISVPMPKYQRRLRDIIYRDTQLAIQQVRLSPHLVSLVKLDGSDLFAAASPRLAATFGMGQSEIVGQLVHVGQSDEHVEQVAELLRQIRAIGPENIAYSRSVGDVVDPKHQCHYTVPSLQTIQWLDGTPYLRFDSVAEPTDVPEKVSFVIATLDDIVS